MQRGSKPPISAEHVEAADPAKGLAWVVRRRRPQPTEDVGKDCHLATYHAVSRDLCRSTLKARFGKAVPVNGQAGNSAALAGELTCELVQAGEPWTP